MLVPQLDVPNGNQTPSRTQERELQLLGPVAPNRRNQDSSGAPGV
ncbi:hypothetical protein [Paenibacillus tepidiphilus]|nr:hypothetical protein [Paenibacillus tepidiphilus]